MSATRRAACWALTALLCCVVAAMVTADADEQPTPTTWHSGPGDLTEVHP